MLDMCKQKETNSRMSNLFEQLSAMRTQRVPCALMSATEVFDATTGKNTVIRMPGAKPITFEIQQVSPQEIIDADDVLNQAKPPRLTHEESRAGTMGKVVVEDGFDEGDPGYIAERQKLLVKRNALLCIYGCPMLFETTPGETPLAKADKLMGSIGAIVLTWLTNQIERMTMFTGVGEEEVALFLADAPAGATSSGGSKPKAPRGGKSASSKGKTAPPLNTSKTKRRGSGS